MIGEDTEMLVYLVAGEESGDRLGAPLMASLKRLSGGRIGFAGVGGSRMAAEGLSSLFPMHDLAVMGLTEVLPRLPRLIGRLNAVTADIRARRPAVLVTIDAPDFCFRVARRLRGEGIPLVHYVAPSVWAWRPGRAKTVAGFLDHLLTLLPFEPPYFEAHGLACTYVGHPVLQSGADGGDGQAFRRTHGIAETTPLLAVLPGSRAGECRRLLPVFAATLERLAGRFSGLEIAVPTVAETTSQVSTAMAGLGLPLHLVEDEKDKFDAFAAADAALAASGTVALELAMAGLPSVIGYRMAPVTSFFLQRLSKTPYANLINILLGRKAVPEFVLNRCRDDLMADALVELLERAESREAQKRAYGEALEALGLGEIDPNRRAAEAVLRVARGT